MQTIKRIGWTNVTWDTFILEGGLSSAINKQTSLPPITKHNNYVGKLGK